MGLVDFFGKTTLNETPLSRPHQVSQTQDLFLTMEDKMSALCSYLLIVLEL